MAKSPAFQFYASDFLTDTQSWDINEVGIYIRLLSNQWVNGTLPNDLLRLSRIAGCTHEEIKKAWVILGFKFLTHEDGFLYNRKLELVREEQTKFREKQASNGKQGGRPRKIENPNKTQIKPKRNPNNNPNKSSSSSTSNKEIYKEIKHLSLTVEEFDRLVKDGYTKKIIDEHIDKISNYAKNTKYTSLNLTLREWLKRDDIFKGQPTVGAEEEKGYTPYELN